MKHYRFPLSSVLRARRAQEDMARQRLAQANHRIQQARRLHADARAALNAASVAAVQAVTSGAGVVDHDPFVAERAHHDRLVEAVKRAERNIQIAQVEGATCFAAWVEAGKRVASLERLDERRRYEWDVLASQEEAKIVDDVVASRWSPNPAPSALGSAATGVQNGN